MTPLGRSRPVSIATLERDGNRYVSAARSENEGPCLDEDGDAIRGGAKVTSIMRLWLSTVRASGSAVETTEMRGSLELDLEPTPVGSAAGCLPQTAAYELSGRREAVAVRDDPLPDVEQPPNTAGGLANLPRISVKVNGAEVIYFEIEGDTVAELGASLANGGVQSCGAINYEWHEGDTRPAACAVTSFPDIEDAIDQRVSNGNCTIAKSTDPGQVRRPHAALGRPQARAKAAARVVARDRRVHPRPRGGPHRHQPQPLARLNKQLVGEDCEDADSIIGRWAKELSSAQEEFDRKEYQKPWPEPPAGY